MSFHAAYDAAADHGNASSRPRPLVASPMRFSATPVEPRLPPPVLGQHTDEILRDVLGLDAATIAELRASKIV